MFTKQKVGKLLSAGALAVGMCLAGPSFAQAQASTSATGGLPSGVLTDASPQNSLIAFKEYMKYPPESRPLVGANWDLLHPWTADPIELPMIGQRVVGQIESLRGSGMSEDAVWRAVTVPAVVPRYRFESNRAILAGRRDSMEVTLVITGDPTAAPAQVRIGRAELIGDGKFGSPSLGAVPYSCDTSGTRCVLRWKAPDESKKYWGVLTLVVTATLAGSDDEFVMRHTFYSSPMVAGRFTGQFRERLENGSLVISAGVQVERRMACFVSANLFSIEAGLPSQHVQRRLIVDPAMQTISFTFFGKIFRDYGQQGAFRLQDLKGQCENVSYPPEWFMDSTAHTAELRALMAAGRSTSQEPNRIYFEYDEHTYTTRRYAATEFSDREWQSPEATKKLAMYSRSVVELTNPQLEAVKQQRREAAQAQAQATPK